MAIQPKREDVHMCFRCYHSVVKKRAGDLHGGGPKFPGPGPLQKKPVSLVSKYRLRKKRKGRRRWPKVVTVVAGGKTGGRSGLGYLGLTGKTEFVTNPESAGGCEAAGRIAIHDVLD